MATKKEMLIGAVINQIDADLAHDDTSAITELLGFLNEDVMIGYIDEDIVETIFPE